MSGEEDKKPVKNVKSKPAEKSIIDKTTEWLQDHSLVATTGGLIGAVAANEAEKKGQKTDNKSLVDQVTDWVKDHGLIAATTGAAGVVASSEGLGEQKNTPSHTNTNQHGPDKKYNQFDQAMYDLNKWIGTHAPDGYTKLSEKIVNSMPSWMVWESSADGVRDAVIENAKSEIKTPPTTNLNKGESTGHSGGIKKPTGIIK